MISHDAYEWIKTEPLEDLKATGYVFRHKVSGAYVTIIDCDDENKVFYIGFRTPPLDSTGMPHIIEHTVLCGSDKYPVKDPFVELVKGSLNTFLNAMTYPDKTVYPIASTNEQDFKNLMDVYMDAVLHPNIYHDPEIFMQEGWHYELEDEDDDLIINGVVYNEMKGAFSSPEEVISREILNTLYPDTPYHNESGGDPKDIPHLSYEEFLSFHKRYYHPCNSYIYLYGDMDFEERLDYLDREYLSHYPAIDLDSTVALQKPFAKTKRRSVCYPVAAEDDTSDATYLTYSFSIGDALDPTLYYALDILEYALFDAPGAPVKEALLAKGIGKSISGSWNTEMRQPMFSIVARGANAEDEDAFVATIREELKRQAEEGINKKSLYAGINAAEFEVREADFGSYPKGLIFGLNILDSWLYDKEQPFLHLHGVAVLDDLKKKVEEGYFEELITSCFLHNPHALILVATPQRGLASEADEKLKEELAKKMATLSKKEIKTIIAQTKTLKEHQGQPSTPEELTCLPMLQRSDLKREAEIYHKKETSVDGVTVLHHDYDTFGIHYLNFVFTCEEIAQKDLQAVSLMAKLLGSMGTKSYTYAEIGNEINLHTGGISVSMHTYVKENREVILTCEVRTKFLFEKLDEAMHLVEEILFTSDFTDKKRLRELIGMKRSGLEARLKSSGNQYIGRRICAQFSEDAMIHEEMDGISYYRFIKDLDEHFDERVDGLIETMQRLQRQVFVKNHLLVSTTGEKEAYDQAISILPEFVEKLFAYESHDKRKAVLYPKKTEAFKDASQVQYVCCAGNFKDAGYEFSGLLHILRVILSYEYFWVNVRVLGGAYGCHSTFRPDGDVKFVSYRDPKLLETREIFEHTADFLESFDVDERDMTKYVIGTISDFDVPKTPSQKGLAGLAMYLCENTKERRQEIRNQVLDATASDIRGLAPLIRDTMAQGYFGVVGNEDVIEENKESFDAIESLT